MKVLRMALTAALAAALAVPAHAGDFGGGAMRSRCATVQPASDGYWNVRECPNSRSIITEVYPGDQIEVDLNMRRGAWVFVYTASGDTGWIFSNAFRVSRCQ